MTQYRFDSNLAGQKVTFNDKPHILIGLFIEDQPDGTQIIKYELVEDMDSEDIILAQSGEFVVTNENQFDIEIEAEEKKYMMSKPNSEMLPVITPLQIAYDRKVTNSKPKFFGQRTFGGSYNIGEDLVNPSRVSGGTCCKHCGDTEANGAMFTTLAGGNECDDCL